MEVITYSLRGGPERSRQYYKDVISFTDETLAEAERQVRPLVEALQDYVRQTNREAPHTFPECVLDLLVLGVLWRVYAGGALGLAETSRRVLTWLAHLRGSGGWLKPAADLVRGVLIGRLLSPDGRGIQVPPPTLGYLGQLLNWLEATGDFTQEIKRLRACQGFLESQSPPQVADSLADVIRYATWFEDRSERALGPYTPHVERFLAETHPTYRRREDAIFCGRRRVEYHLCMVGTEVLNRAFRKAFSSTTRKVVLLPPCMKAQPDERCRARPTGLGAHCAACTPDCRIRQLTELGQELGFGVLILPNELGVFSSKEMKPPGGDTVGIVGVSCVLTNPSGGWETADLGIPAQGVPLDYCGCNYHWHAYGIPTDVNTDQLLRVLGIAGGKLQEV